jgi:hypothetical protein
MAEPAAALAFAADLVGLGSAAVLLVPAFGQNNVAKAVARLRLIASRGGDAKEASIREAAKDLAQSMESRSARWSPADETLLRIGSVALALSVALKLLAHRFG